MEELPLVNTFACYILGFIIAKLLYCQYRKKLAKPLLDSKFYALQTVMPKERVRCNNAPLYWNKIVLSTQISPFVLWLFGCGHAAFSVRRSVGPSVWWSINIESKSVKTRIYDAAVRVVYLWEWAWGGRGYGLGMYAPTHPSLKIVTPYHLFLNIFEVCLNWYLKFHHCEIKWQ